MTQQTMKTFTFVAVLAAASLLTVGCAKKAAKAVPPAPPAPTAPTATLAANPSVVQQGQSSTLTWDTTNANEVSIAGLGTVPASGSRSVKPGDSTTYTLVAKGPGGSSDASARVTVNTPAASAAAPSLSDEELFARNVKDVFFDYDKYSIRPDETPKVNNNESFLTQHPSIKVLVEGHCDDRGSEEYNIALGANRAQTLKQALVQEGVPAAQVRTVSFGKEKPFCTEDNESCWQQNRVDHFAFDR